jgi:hypothetical protein
VKTSQNEDTATGTPGSDPAAAAASGSAAVAATPAASATPLVTPPVVGEGGTPAPILEVIPEKYRVLGGDGTLDLEASARKQADAYKQLEAKLGSGDSSEADVQALMKSKAYWDATDPQHESTKARVAEFYARQHGTAPR